LRCLGEAAKARWQRIAEAVSGRTLKECVARYKEIRERLLARSTSSSAQAPIEEKTRKERGASLAAAPPPPPEPAKTPGISVGYAPKNKPLTFDEPPSSRGGAKGGGFGVTLVDSDSGETLLGSGGSGGGHQGGWWRNLDDDDPISLEPLSSLPYPPFELANRPQPGSARVSVHYFDGQVLAYYLVSTATFFDPLSREPLTREDCARLDQ